jgi:hypothetical protein
MMRCSLLLVTGEIAPEKIDAAARENESLVTHFGNIFELDLHCAQTLDSLSRTTAKQEGKKRAQRKVSEQVIVDTFA